MTAGGDTRQMFPKEFSIADRVLEFADRLFAYHRLKRREKILDIVLLGLYTKARSCLESVILLLEYDLPAKSVLREMIETIGRIHCAI